LTTFGVKNTLITWPKIVYWLALTASAKSREKNNFCSIIQNADQLIINTLHNF